MIALPVLSGRPTQRRTRISEKLWREKKTPSSTSAFGMMGRGRKEGYGACWMLSVVFS